MLSFLNEKTPPANSVLEVLRKLTAIVFRSFLWFSIQSVHVWNIFVSSVNESPICKCDTLKPIWKISKRESNWHHQKVSLVWIANVFPQLASCLKPLNSKEFVFSLFRFRNAPLQTCAISIKLISTILRAVKAILLLKTKGLLLLVSALSDVEK